MLNCVWRSKTFGCSLHEQLDNDGATTSSIHQAIKALTTQIKEMVLRATGAYRQCKPCTEAGTRARGYEESEMSRSGSDRYVYGYHRAGESSTLTPCVYVGLELKVYMKNGGFVSSEKLENGIRSLMEGEEGRKVRQRAEEMKVSGRKVVEEGGSYTSLELLVY